MRADFGVVILTMGRRPDELASAVQSLRAQQDVLLDVVIVGNGWDPATKFPNEKTLHLLENLGIPAGRNAGTKEVEGEFYFFLDDDVLLHDPKTLAKMKQLFDERAEIGLIQPRVMALVDGDTTPKRWIPRLRVGDEHQSSVATSLWEGATAIRSELFERVGGWPSNFFYAHEGIELVWRTLDQGFLPWYAAEIEVKHPVIDPARHEYYFFLNARNRVWLARRNLRFPFSFLYPLTWIVITLLRLRGGKELRAWFSGLFKGVFSSCSSKDEKDRKKLHWRTHLLLARYGRPPII